MQLSSHKLQELATNAWAAREMARILGDTRVGAAALDEHDAIHRGCNVEHGFRSHDIHAETNAISTMIATGARRLKAILVAAERDRFTPCGACMDWIFEFGGPECTVLYQNDPSGRIQVHTAAELMPYYPA